MTAVSTSTLSSLILSSEPAVHNATGSGAISETTAINDHFELLGFTLKLSAAGTTSEALTIGLDANDGATYDCDLYKVSDTSSGSPTSLSYFFPSPVICELGDEITVTWPNSEGRTWGLRVVTRVV